MEVDPKFYVSMEAQFEERIRVLLQRKFIRCLEHVEYKRKEVQTIRLT